VWEGFPVLTGGVSDTDRHFHPTFLAVTEGESEEDFTFLFEGLTLGVGDTFKPQVLIAD